MPRSVLVPGETYQQYLGDGVYASFDGYQIWLRVEREFAAVHEIALEPEVYDALRLWHTDILNDLYSKGQDIE